MDDRIINNKYILNAIIGSGGMAIVYKGIQMDTGEAVAIKMLRPEYLNDQSFVKRFKKEASIARHLTNKHIVNTIDMGEEDGVPYIIMEYVDGRTLKEYIKEKGILNHEEAVGIAIQICEALKYAHSKRLIHRDIKPQNVLLGNDGIVKVGDFGIAKMATSSTVTMSGSNVMGSVHYMSPEQAKGGIVNEKADFYAFGIVLYEMLTGTVPFTGDTPVSVAIQHIQNKKISPKIRNPHVWTALDEIVLKATANQKDKRYNKANEIIDDLITSLRYHEGGFVKLDEETNKEGTRKIPIITPELLDRFGKNTDKDHNKRIYQKRKIKETHETSKEQSVPPVAKRHRVHFSIARLLLALLLLAGILFSMLLIAKSFYQNSVSRNKGTIPQVQGLDAEQAIKLIKEAGFEYIIEYQNHETTPESLIIKQSPLPDEVINYDEMINIVISLGPTTAIVPNLKNYTYTQATKMIEDAGFAVGNVQQEVSDIPKDYVIRQDPVPETKMPLGDKIHIWIAIEDNTLKYMPELLNQELESALIVLDKLAIDMTNIELIYVDSGYLKDIIINQVPVSGSIIENASIIKIYLSNGEGEGYVQEKKVLLSIEKDNTKVKIVYTDGAISKTVYEQDLSKGDHTVTLTLSTTTPGEKILTIYYNNEVHANDRITFNVN